jgi:ribonuclease HI
VKGKYYAVRRGRNVGIYETWAACERQIKGFSGAEHQSFRTKQEAYQFLAAPGRERPKDRSEQRNHDPEGGFEASKSQDKIKQTFKCPKFSGNAKDWKLWNKGFNDTSPFGI